ncbi:hypothetical protein CW714_05300 [Methanophagales archaeon]|nr:MAG: hypothetical protein CW714_05300 [Methanophagales archaeon]
MPEAIYEDNLKCGFILKLVLCLAIGVLLALTIWIFYLGEVIGGIIILITLIFTIILLFALIPRKYQICNDRIKVICGLLKLNIPFDDIKSIETRPPYNIWGSFEALRFGTGTGERCIMIKRKRGMNILVQPSDTERFMEILNNTMKRMVEPVER